MEKIRLSLIFIIVCSLLLFCVACKTLDIPPGQENPNLTLNDNISGSFIGITGDGFLNSEDCMKRGLNDKVIMLESKYCGHCKATLPDFIQACEEKNITPIILDISEKTDREIMESYDIDVRYTPTFIFGCDYFIGSKKKEEYLSLLDNFLKGD